MAVSRIHFLGYLVEIHLIQLLKVIMCSQSVLHKMPLHSTTSSNSIILKYKVAPSKFMIYQNCDFHFFFFRFKKRSWTEPLTPGEWLDGGVSHASVQNVPSQVRSQKNLNLNLIWNRFFSPLSTDRFFSETTTNQIRKNS